MTDGQIDQLDAQLAALKVVTAGLNEAVNRLGRGDVAATAKNALSTANALAFRVAELERRLDRLSPTRKRPLYDTVDVPAQEPPAAAVPDPRMMSAAEMCRKYHVQACGYCERLACGDNTSPGEELLRAARKVVDATGGVMHVVMPVLNAAIKKVEAMG